MKNCASQKNNDRDNRDKINKQLYYLKDSWLVKSPNILHSDTSLLR